MAETSATPPAPEKAPPKSTGSRDKPDQRIIIRSYPKAIFFYPLMLCSLICGILLKTGAAEVQTVGFIFMCVFFFNLVIVSFEFTRYVSVAVVLSLLVFVLLGIQLNEKFKIVQMVASLYGYMTFHANPAFFFGVFACFVVTFLLIFIDTRFDYWELRGNEVLHHHGFLGDVERFPAPSLKLKKEINDVFEYLLLFSGRLVIFPSGAERAIELANVPRINYLEELITHKLHSLKVTFDQA